MMSRYQYICGTMLLLLAGAGSTGQLSGANKTSGVARQRRLYVTDKSGISVYDIDHGHRLLKKIDVPYSGDYKGIAASVQLGKLYV
ncbi:MAG: hypothetical protein ACRD3W_03410, partial [Terriglobales bacterium]